MYIVMICITHTQIHMHTHAHTHTHHGYICKGSADQAAWGHFDNI